MGPQPKRCHHCKSTDHLIADCPLRRKDSEGGVEGKEVGTATVPKSVTGEDSSTNSTKTSSDSSNNQLSSHSSKSKLSASEAKSEPGPSG